MYRSRADLAEEYSISERTVDRLVRFIKDNTGKRYRLQDIITDGWTVRIDEQAFLDAFRYRRLIAIGKAPKYRRTA